MSDKPRYKSGAQKAREKKAREAAEHKARAALHGDPVGPEKFKKLGLPPDDAVGTIAYANRAAGLLLHDVLVDEALAESERRKLAKDFIAVIGMTGVKALYEERLKKVEQQVGISDKADHGSVEQYPSEGGSPLRAARARRSGDEIPRPVPGIQKEDIGPDPAEGGRSVGPPDEDVH